MTASDALVKNLTDDIVLAVSEGCRKIVIWGIDADGLALLTTLYANGLISFVSAIVDHDPTVVGRSFLGYQVRSADRLQELDLDTLVITSDKNKEQVLEEFSRLDCRTPRVIFAGNTNYEFDDPAYQEILRSCPVKSKVGGYSQMLIHLYQALKYIATRKLQGSVAEFGVYQAGTTVFMAKVLQLYEHPIQIYGFDTFGGFPPSKSVMDIYRDRKCEFADYETVKRYCSTYNIDLVPGDICETYTTLRGIPLALSFFDTDVYSPTRRALGLCLEQTVPGGILAFDHYYSPDWNKTIGERIAVKQVLEGKNVFNLHGTGIFLKL